MSEIGTTIKKMRKEKNLSLRTLATLSGISHPYLSQIETGRNKPSPAIVEKLAKGLRCNYRALMSMAGYEKVERDEVLLELIEELVTLNLWSARRLNKGSKDFAYDILDELTNKKHERV